MGLAGRSLLPRQCLVCLPKFPPLLPGILTISPLMSPVHWSFLMGQRRGHLLHWSLPHSTQLQDTPDALPPCPGPLDAWKLCPLQEVIEPTGLPIRLRTPFSMQDLSQMKQDLGKFSDDHEKYLNKFRPQMTSSPHKRNWSMLGSNLGSFLLHACLPTSSRYYFLCGKTAHLCLPAKWTRPCTVTVLSLDIFRGPGKVSMPLPLCGASPTPPEKREPSP